jgi:hypothetical protein
MLYHVSRNGQTYGPYTLEDLQRYVASGNVLLTDLARSESMSEWLPVSQILGGSPSAFAPPQAPPPAGYAPYPVGGSYSDPPNLHWGLVLLFAFFTCTLFMWVWNLVVASWLKRVQPHSKAIVYYAAATVLLVVQMVFSTHYSMTHVRPGYYGYGMWTNFYFLHPMRAVLGLVVWVVRLVARFTMRSELEEYFNGPDPVGLSLSGVMTFFFGGLYFQYHLNRINEIKRMARHAAPPLR